MLALRMAAILVSGKMHGCTSNPCVRLLLYFLPCVILKMLWLTRLGEVSIITFRRWLPEDLRLQWEKILSDVSTYNFGNGSDMVLCSLEKNNKFSVK